MDKLNLNKNNEHDWIAPKDSITPDFIICGAMKSGTSTIHALLNKHPEIYIPNSEIHFFDIDNIFQHSDFYFKETNNWEWPNISDDPLQYWKWYNDFFKKCPQGAIVGEDSTTYLASPKAAHRISMQNKPIKIIICLRHPTRRAYSQYWHMLRTGRAMFNFEDTIKFTPNYVLKRSMYYDQITDFMRYIPREHMFFFILEEFLVDKERVIRELSNFLSLEYNQFPDDALTTHANKAKIPKYIKLQTLKNRIMRSFGNKIYNNNLPFSVGNTNKSSLFPQIINKIHNIINPKSVNSTPKMGIETQNFLDSYFKRELQGLSDLIEIDIDKIWFNDHTK